MGLIVKTFVKFCWHLYLLLTLAKTKIRWDAICLRCSVAGPGEIFTIHSWGESRLRHRGPVAGAGNQNQAGAGQGAGQGGGQGNKIIWFMVEIIRVVQKPAIIPRPGTSSTRVTVAAKYRCGHDGVFVVCIGSATLGPIRKYVHLMKLFMFHVID